MSCGTGSDAIYLAEQRGFHTVACVEICSLAVLQAIGKLWKRLADRRATAHIFHVRGDGQIDRWDAPGLPTPGSGDPRIEFHEQDNLALDSLWEEGGGGSAVPKADLIYDNSAYNNLRNAEAFPGALLRYFAAVGRLLEPERGLLHIVSGDSQSEAKVPFFPEHSEAELRADLATAVPELTLLAGYPRPCVYDFQTFDARTLQDLPAAHAARIEAAGGTRGWSALCRAPADFDEL